jgi:hypothetical protein
MNGPAKSTWTLSQGADGHSHGCSGATCGIFCVSWHPSQHLTVCSIWLSIPGVTSDAIARETRRDRVLSRVYEQVKNGWKEGNHDELLKPFYNRKSEIITTLNSLLDLTIDFGPPHVTTSYGLHTDYSRMSFMKQVLNTGTQLCGHDENNYKDYRSITYDIL